MLTRRVPWNLLPVGRPQVDFVGNPFSNKLVAGLVSHPGIDMIPIVPGTTKANPFGLSGLSKVITPGGPFEKHGGASYENQVNFPQISYYHTVSMLVCVRGTVSLMQQFLQCTGAGNGYCARFDITASKTVTAYFDNTSVTGTIALREGLNVITLTNMRLPASGEQRLYVNGVLDQTAAANAWQGFTCNALVVGRNTSGDSSVGGAWVHNRILNADEVLKLSDNFWLPIAP